MLSEQCEYFVVVVSKNSVINFGTFRFRFVLNWPATMYLDGLVWTLLKRFKMDTNYLLKMIAQWRLGCLLRLIIHYGQNTIDSKLDYNLLSHMYV